MNKLSTKQPISSPNRTDHFPPPLMNFLRTDTGNRSRTGRSRFSPIFIKKKNISNFETTLEPSSPKVTCMGQVRIRSNSKTKKKTADNPVGCRWVWIRMFWKKRVLFFRRNSSVSESRVGNEKKEEDDNEGGGGRDDDDDDVRVFVSENLVSLPPKNALILTRCRSAPFRSSNLNSSSGYGLWSSSTRKSEEEEEEEGNKSNNERENDQKMKGREEERESSPGSLRPLILTRCKSEPAVRVSDKLLLGI